MRCLLVYVFVYSSKQIVNNNNSERVSDLIARFNTGAAYESEPANKGGYKSGSLSIFTRHFLCANKAVTTNAPTFSRGAISRRLRPQALQPRCSFRLCPPLGLLAGCQVG